MFITHTSGPDSFSLCKLSKPGVGIKEYFPRVDFNCNFPGVNMNGSIPALDCSSNFVGMDVNGNSMGNNHVEPESPDKSLSNFWDTNFFCYNSFFDKFVCLL